MKVPAIKMSEVKGKAPGKLLLFGEHSAVYGYPSIGVALPWELEVIMSEVKNESGSFKGSSSDSFSGSLSDSFSDSFDESSSGMELLVAELRKFFPSLPPAKFSVKSEIPIGVGFGSSGALCVALVRAVSQLVGDNGGFGGSGGLGRSGGAEGLKGLEALGGLRGSGLLQNAQIWEHAHKLETLFHHRPSGIDTGLSTYGGCCSFEGIPARLTQLDPVTLCPLVIGAIERGGSTASLVKMVGERQSSDPMIGYALRELGGIADLVISGGTDLLANPWELGAMAKEAHGHLKMCGLSTDTLDAIVNIGGCGGKLSGAGGGGAYYIVPKSLDDAESIIASIKELGIPHVLEPVCLSSVKVGEGC